MPLVVGSSIEPRALSGINHATLPVTYHANLKAWMRSEIFGEWLKELDQKFREDQIMSFNEEDSLNEVNFSYDNDFLGDNNNFSDNNFSNNEFPDDDFPDDDFPDDDFPDYNFSDNDFPDDNFSDDNLLDDNFPDDTFPSNDDFPNDDL
ncbi:22663_t:CDS:2 [Gigaspora margarita]|uniref:22663_t:CDS:1 n=1 Tax=Gigaspora margarita TaxID=4874 RepID=A0ABN7VSM1_GIGMA|nr:22663_t:CDS:2 [Gigaspora margarita]